MKTIKFRVWDEYHKRFLISLNDNGLMFGFGNASNEDIEKYGGWSVTDCLITPNCGLTVQQFTGLLDKNGKEIYEGDILLVKGYDDWFDTDGHDYKLTVKWKSEENGDISESCGYLYIPTEREVIGNIHERKLDVS